MSSGERLLVLGKQGAGKGTQAVPAGGRTERAPHLHRRHVPGRGSDGTSFGRKAKDFMDRGELVPDDVVIGLGGRASGPGRRRQPGVPPRRVPPDAHARPRSSSASSGPGGLDAAVDIEVPDRRRARPAVGPAGLPTAAPPTTSTAPPKVNWTCDNDGGAVVQRDDDTEAHQPPPGSLRARDRPPARLLRRARPARPRGRCGRARRSVRPDPRRRSRPCGQLRLSVPPAVPRRDHPQDARPRSPSCARPGVWWPRSTSTVSPPPGRGRPPPTSTGSPGRSSTGGGPVQLPQLPRVPGRHLHLPERRDRPRHPRRLQPGGGRHPLHRRRGDHRGLARRRGRHRPRRRGQRGGGPAHGRHPASLEARSRRSWPATTSATSARRWRPWPSRPASRSYASTWATGSARPCTRSRPSRTTGSPGGGCGSKRATSSPSNPWSTRAARDGDPGGRLDRGHPGRVALGPLRAHDRRDRPRSGGAYAPLRGNALQRDSRHSPGNAVSLY